MRRILVEAARHKHRLVEPVGVDRVVDVVHRVELLRADGEGGPGGLGRGLAHVDAGKPECRRRWREGRFELLRDPGRGAAVVEQHPIDVDPADKPPIGVVELRPAAGPDAAKADGNRRADQFGPDPDRGDDRDLGGPDQPDDPALGVPGPIESPGSGVNAGQVLRITQQDRSPDQPVRAAFIEADAVRRLARPVAAGLDERGIGLRGHIFGHASSLA